MEWRVQPVFVSSTFRDIQAERDHLQHVVFPAVEERLRERRLHVEPVDLRVGLWSNENEAAGESRILTICLKEVKRCRPFVIVLLGHRYGWVPPEVQAEYAATEAGVRMPARRLSVSALEIECALRAVKAESRDRSFVYLREPLPWTEMPRETAADYCEEFAADEDAGYRHA
jgi:hypothetical protein